MPIWIPVSRANIFYKLIKLAEIWYIIIRYSTEWYDIKYYSKVCVYRLVRYIMVQYRSEWHYMVQNGSVWYRMVQYGIVHVRRTFRRLDKISAFKSKNKRRTIICLIVICFLNISSARAVQKSTKMPIKGSLPANSKRPGKNRWKRRQTKPGIKAASGS